MTRRLCVLAPFACFGLSLLFCGLGYSQNPKPGENAYVNKLRAIHVQLTESGAEKASLVEDWLENEFSGYPDLADVLLRGITPPPGGCMTPGGLLPLDVIERFCRESRNDRDRVIRDHTVKQVREAYRQTWLERHSDAPKDTSLDEILSGKIRPVSSKGQHSRQPKNRDLIQKMLLDRHVVLTQVEDKHEMIWGWILREEGSGYGNLIEVLERAIPVLEQHKVNRFRFVPLDSLEVHCRGARVKAGTLPDINSAILDHTEDEVRKAYRKAWLEVNGTPVPAALLPGK